MGLKDFQKTEKKDFKDKVFSVRMTTKNFNKLKKLNISRAKVFHLGMIELDKALKKTFDAQDIRRKKLYEKNEKKKK